MKFKKSITTKNSIDITPMVDIVFLLIIFFMVSTTFVKTSGIKINLPEAVSSDSQPKNDIILSVNTKGEIFVGDKKVRLGSLGNVLKKRKLKKDSGVLIIRGDENIKYRTLVEVMDIAKMTGIEKISLATGKRK